MDAPCSVGIPTGACRTGASPVFSEHSVPDALRDRHTLASGNWARLCVGSGTVTFVDLDDGSRTTLSAPARYTIAPGRPHRVELPAAATFHLEFHRERR